MSIINQISRWSPKADIVTVKASGKFLGFINVTLAVLHPEYGSHLPDLMYSAPPDPVVSEGGARVSRIRIFRVNIFSFVALFNLSSDASTPYNIGTISILDHYVLG